MPQPEQNDPDVPPAVEDPRNKSLRRMRILGLRGRNQPQSLTKKTSRRRPLQWRRRRQTRRRRQLRRRRLQPFL
jgi:hypothetical protein